MRVVVIGAGIGGLSLALYLASRGEEVHVLEKLDAPGGRARVLRERGYQFDMGPSWYLMPEVFEGFYRSVGESPPEVSPVDPLFSLKVGKFGDPGRSQDFFKGELDWMQDYLEDVEFIYKLAMGRFLYKELRAIDLLDGEILKNLGRFPILSTLDQFNRRYFKDDFVLKALGFSSVFLGGSPYNVPAVYSMVNYSIFGQGVFYPKGGFGGLVERLYTACKRKGVEFSFGSEAEGVEVKGDRMTSVKVRGKEVQGDVFVFNADYRFADSLLPYELQLGENYWNRRKLAPSALLFYLGVDGDPGLPHHTVVVNGDWKEHFEALRKGVPPDPRTTSYYVSYRAATDRDLRFKDLVILIPMSPGVQVEPEPYLKMVLEDLRVKSMVELQVNYSRVYGTKDFVLDYNAFKGTAFGLAHTLDQTGPFRPPVKHRKVKNLYFVGQYTQPGIGVPMVTLSAMIVGEKILGSS